MTDEAAPAAPPDEVPPEVPPETCGECGVAPAAYDGICLQCQTWLHELGAYDMDGAGW